MGKHILPNAEFLISAGDQSDSSKTDIAIEEYYEFRSPDELKNIPVAVNNSLGMFSHTDDHDRTIQGLRPIQKMPRYTLFGDSVFFPHLNAVLR